MESKAVFFPWLNYLFCGFQPTKKETTGKMGVEPKILGVVGT